MQELITMQYTELKNRLDRELNMAAQSFVSIGYLLRVARDTDALAGSGYSDVSEFAKAEYGLDRSQVSRFIRINERFGNGEALLEQYEGFGSSKLAEMLMLPDNVAAELPAQASKSEIRALAADLAEDQKKTTDLEIAMEDHSDESVWLQAFREYFRLRPDEYVTLAERMAEGYPTIALMDVLAPSGISLKTIRISGIGKVTISFRGNRPASLLETRSGNREEKEVGAIAEELNILFERVKELSARGAWSMLYNEPFPAEAEENIEEPKTMPAPVAPAQQEEGETDAGEEKQKEPEAEPKKETPARKEPAKPAKKTKVIDIVKPAEKPSEKENAHEQQENAHNRQENTHDEQENAHDRQENAHALEESAGQPEENSGEEAQEAAEAKAEELPEDIVDRDDEELQKAKKLAETPVTVQQVLKEEIRRCHRLLGESIEEENWARARGFSIKIREHIDRIEKELEEEDKAQMSIEDYPEFMPAPDADGEEQEDE